MQHKVIRDLKRKERVRLRKYIGLETMVKDGSCIPLPHLYFKAFLKAVPPQVIYWHLFAFINLTAAIINLNFFLVVFEMIELNG